MFSAPQLTNAGKALYYRNMDGDGIKFTTIQMGSGTITGGIATMTALVNPVVTITGALKTYDTYVSVSGRFSNASLVEGFYWREIGLFAADPDFPDDRTKDILYCYQNAYDAAEYIPVASVETLEKYITMPVIVGDVSTITCTLTQSEISATLADLEAHSLDAAAHPGKLNTTGDGSAVTAAFTQSGTRANILTGETLAVVFGKIKKWFADLGAAAFLNVGTTAGTVADGAAPASAVSTHNTAVDAHATKFLEKQNTTESLTAETALADADTIPFYDASATGNRKTLWSNIKSVLKTYFDTLYAAISHTHGSITNAGAIGSTADLPVFTGTSGTLGTKTAADARAALGAVSISDLSAKQDKTDSLTAETALVDADTIPFYDASAAGHRKALWSNIKSVLKIYFDTLYAAISHSHGSITNSGAIGSTADLPVFTGTSGTLGTKSAEDARTALGVDPVGSIKTSITTLGEKWILCNGAVVSEATYPALYALVSVSTGAFAGRAGNSTTIGAQYAFIVDANNILMAGNGSYSSVYYSTNGWVSVNTTSPYGASTSYTRCHGIVYFGGRYVALLHNSDGYGGPCFSSTLTASAYSVGYGYAESANAYNLIVAGKYCFYVNSYGGTNYFQYSTDGVNWYNNTYTSSTGYAFVWYVNGSYITKVGTNYYISASGLASSGTTCTVPITPTRFTYFDGYYIAQNGTQIAYATSLTGTWTTETLSGYLYVALGRVLRLVQGSGTIYVKRAWADGWQPVILSSGTVQLGYESVFADTTNSRILIAASTVESSVTSARVYAVTLDTVPTLSESGAYVYIKAIS